MNWQQTITLSLIVFFIQPVKTMAIGSPVSDSSLPVIRTVAAYQKTIKNTAGKQLINLQTYIPGIITELRYAEANNFMQQQLYPTNAIALLRLDAAIALKKVQLELNQAQLGIKIWDAYRPYSITVKMWNLIKDERFVADPRKGSGHNRGIAVDLTLINLSDGQEIFMGTSFDHFSDTAHHGFKNLPEEILAKRQLLKATMEKYGFKALETEWWHYYLIPTDKYELLDIPFKAFTKDKKRQSALTINLQQNYQE